MPAVDFEQLGEPDLEFLIDTVAPETANRERIKEVVRTDPDFRNAFIAEERVFRRVMDDEQILLRISPRLYFEILLRRAARELKESTYTLEKAGAVNVPVFDAGRVAELLQQQDVLLYVADMLSSFTRINSYTIRFRDRKRIWRRIRFNDMDIQSLQSFCDVVAEDYRFALYKRIADICLFILGLFPEYADYAHRYPSSKQPRPQIRGTLRYSPEQYRRQGVKFYRLAAEHEAAQRLHLNEAFQALQEHFTQVCKPLNFIADRYLHSKKYGLFES